MENANGDKPSGQRRNPGSRRWYGYTDVVTPSQPPMKPVVEPTPPQLTEAVPTPQVSPPFSEVEEPELVAVEAPRPLPRPKRTRLPILVIVLYVLAALLFVVGGFIAWQGLRADDHATEQIPPATEVTEDDGSNPATTPITENSKDAYVVAPQLPRLLTIDKLGIKARVMPLGVTSANKLKAPSNIYDVGWYNASSQPGDPGAMLMDGHVSSWESDGVFKNIKKLVPGDELTVERGDGQVFRYRVMKSQAYDEAQTDMQAALQPVTEGKNGLNLITCYGRIKPGTSEFEQRLIVFTEQI